MGARLTIILLLSTAVCYGWSIHSFPRAGYDANGHFQYVAILLDEGRLPHPLEGWSTFHPPLYYLIAGLLSFPRHPVWLPYIIQGIGSVALLVAGCVSLSLLRRRGTTTGVALVAAALVMLIPSALLAATMVGNEALGVGIASLAVPGLMQLQRDPRNLKLAATLGLLAGLALLTKFTGLFLAGACIVPFCRSDLDRRGLRALVVLAVVMIGLAGPFYARNVMLTGSPVPMTRDQEPVKSVEDMMTIRERRVSDYLWIDPRALLRPWVRFATGKPAAFGTLNPAMTNVWGMLYASMWYDAHSIRLHPRFIRDSTYVGPVLTLLGIFPTTMLLIGFLAASRECLRRGSATEWLPIVVMSLLGLTAFLIFTWRAPSVTAIKASYLLPLAVPAALFFSRGIGNLPSLLRKCVLTVSIVAVLASSAVFTGHLVFPPAYYPPRQRDYSTPLAAVQRLLTLSSRGRWLWAKHSATEPDSPVRWEIGEDFLLPPASANSRKAWCGYIGEFMEQRAPSRQWTAEILRDGGAVHTCSSESSRAESGELRGADNVPER